MPHTVVDFLDVIIEHDNLYIKNYYNNKIPLNYYAGNENTVYVFRKNGVMQKCNNLFNLLTYCYENPDVVYLPFTEHKLCIFKFMYNYYMIGNNHSFIFGSDEGIFCSNDPSNVNPENSFCRQDICDHVDWCGENEEYQTRTCDFFARNLPIQELRVFRDPNMINLVNNGIILSSRILFDRTKNMYNINYNYVMENLKFKESLYFYCFILYFVKNGYVENSFCIDFDSEDILPLEYFYNLFNILNNKFDTRYDYTFLNIQTMNNFHDCLISIKNKMHDIRATQNILSEIIDFFKLKIYPNNPPHQVMDIQECIQYFENYNNGLKFNGNTYILVDEKLSNSIDLYGVYSELERMLESPEYRRLHGFRPVYKNIEPREYKHFYE